LVVTAAPRAATSTRRGLLGASGAALLATGAVVSGCGRTSRRPKVHKIPPQARSQDVRALNASLALTHHAIAAYTAGIPLLVGSAHSAAKHCLNQELTHAGELFGLVKQAGGTPVKPAASYDLGHSSRQSDILRLLIGLESEQMRGYLAAIPIVSPGDVRAAAASMFANDAQHLTVLRQALGTPALRGPFVTGA
jgi:ferritin-like protein